MKEEVFLRYSRDSSQTGNCFLIRCRILSVIEEKNTVRLCVCERGDVMAAGYMNSAQTSECTSLISFTASQALKY